MNLPSVLLMPLKLPLSDRNEEGMTEVDPMPMWRSLLIQRTARENEFRLVDIASGSEVDLSGNPRAMSVVLGAIGQNNGSFRCSSCQHRRSRNGVGTSGDGEQPCNYRENGIPANAIHQIYCIAGCHSVPSIQFSERDGQISSVCKDCKSIVHEKMVRWLHVERRSKKADFSARDSKAAT